MYQSALELARQIRTGETTATAITQAHVAQIKEYNPTLNAVVILLEESALREAAACDAEARQGRFRGPLHGVPMTVKEQYWVKDTPSTLNFKMLKDWVAPADAVVVERLKKAGVIIMGKTNVPQNLLDYQVWGDIYPEGKNPYCLARTPGGSSGGAAAALAAGMTPLELGSDFGGSIRVPANYCGVYGLKPTEKTIPEHGMGPVPKDSKGFVSHMASAGPMARTIDDLEFLWKILRGPHPSDRQIARIDWEDADAKPLSEFRIAWVDGWPGYQPSAEVQTRVRAFVEEVKKQGGRVENAAPANQLHQRSLALFVRLFPQMIAQGVPGFIKPLLKMQIQNSLMKGMTKFQSDYDKGFQHSYENYGETMTRRAALVDEWEMFFENYDLLVCPLSFGPAYERCKIGAPITQAGKTLTYVDYVWPYVGCFNGTGHPALNLPLGLDADGLPVGIQIVGPYWSEPRLLRFARLASEFGAGFVPPTL